MKFENSQNILLKNYRLEKQEYSAVLAGPRNRGLELVILFSYSVRLDVLFEQEDKVSLN